MKVREALEALKTLKIAGKGEVELIAMDSRSGDTSRVSISSRVMEIKEDYLYDMGTLCGRPAGYKYVGVYLDH